MFNIYENSDKLLREKRKFSKDILNLYSKDILAKFMISFAELTLRSGIFLLPEDLSLGF